MSGPHSHQEQEAIPAVESENAFKNLRGILKGMTPTLSDQVLALRHEDSLAWETINRGPLNTKLLELRGKYKDIFEALGGGDAFLAELRREPEEPAA